MFKKTNTREVLAVITVILYFIAVPFIPLILFGFMITGPKETTHINTEKEKVVEEMNYKEQEEPKKENPAKEITNKDKQNKEVPNKEENLNEEEQEPIYDYYYEEDSGDSYYPGDNYYYDDNTENNPYVSPDIKIDLTPIESDNYDTDLDGYH
ncbi:hypothetical protein NSA24_03175 [Clostridioides mangenotii]|uniref:hypothetical protein n=1 Tax=Metaclostridioides mangenotii TaxID=1540 RepID=UPI002149C318|nr:hypothetical protein [Clostridioides mangenotii]MCR1953836.1 hypothetical protein [Clostridioides mangenotii]